MLYSFITDGVDVQRQFPPPVQTCRSRVPYKCLPILRAPFNQYKAVRSLNEIGVNDKRVESSRRLTSISTLSFGKVKALYYIYPHKTVEHTRNWNDLHN